MQRTGSKRNLRRFLAMTLTALMLAGNLSVTAFAAELDPDDTGSNAGSNITVTEITDQVYDGKDAGSEADSEIKTDPETDASQDVGSNIGSDASTDADQDTDLDSDQDAGPEPTPDVIDGAIKKDVVEIVNPDGSVTIKEITEEVWNNGDSSSKTETSVTTDPSNNDAILNEKEHFESTETSKDAIDDVLTDDSTIIGDVDITVKPGETVTETVDRDELLDSMRPDTSGDEWSETENGGHIKTEEIENGSTTTTVDQVLDADGNVMGWTTTVTTETVETSKVEFDVPEAGEFDNPDGTKTTVELHIDADGNVTGYVETVNTYDENGVLVATVTKTVNQSGEVTVKKTQVQVTTETVDPDSETKVTVGMGQVVAGENHGALNTSGLDVDMSQFPDTDGVDFDQLGDDDLVYIAGVGIKSKHDIVVMHGNTVNSINQKGKLTPCQYIVVDKNGNKHVVYCADMSVPAVSDVKYYMTNTEDADYFTDAKNHGANKNDIKDPTGGDHLREIAANGYWGTESGTGSLEKMIEDLLAAKANGDKALENVSEDEIRSLTSDLALSGTQAAIWRYGNSLSQTAVTAGSVQHQVGTITNDTSGTTMVTTYDEKTATFTTVTTKVDPETGETTITTETKAIIAPPGVDLDELIKVERDENGDITSVTYPYLVKQYVKLIPDGWINGSNQMHTLLQGAAKDSPENRLAMAVYNYLCGLDITEDKTTDLIQPSDIVEAVASVKNQVSEKDDSGRDTYEADVSFVLTVEPSRLNGDLLVRVYDSVTGELIDTRRVAGDGSNDDESIKQAAGQATADGKGITITIDGLRLANGQTVNINLVGSQAVEKGAYLITAENGYGDSQTFIGVEEGTRDVDLSFTLTLDVESGAIRSEYSDPTTTTTTTTTQDSEATYNYWVLDLPENPPVVPEEPETPPVDPEDPENPENPPVDPDEPEIPENPPVTPEDPEDPVLPPVVPDEPNTPSEPPVEDIPEPDVPLTGEPPVEDIPVEDPPVEIIPDPDVPLTDIPVIEEEIPEEDIPLVDIPDEDIPLADVPQTGDNGMIVVYAILSVLSMAGCAILLAPRKTKQD